ncbi:MAG TPA: rhomboid family intramembrane serine protease [Longimicrobiales bacterium]|nr:rhomboid family intramembrane serine protease [Longimicrobiales bacterium]
MTPVVQFLLLANVAVFFIQTAAPALMFNFAFVPVHGLLRPWTVVSYMFLHGGLMHLFFNMLGLFFFGVRVEDRMGSKRFAIMYFLSGVSGALLSAIFSPGSPIIGASAGVFGVMLAFAYFWPNAVIHIWGIFPVPASVLVIVTTVIAVSSGFGPGRDGIAHFAHLGGYAGAFLYLRRLDRSKASFKRKATAPTPAANHRLARWRSIDLSKVHQVNRDEVTRLLNKIETQGVGSLTGPERVFLAGFIPPDEPSATTSP